MKKIAIALLALLLALPAFVSAQDTLTLSGADLNEAQRRLFAADAPGVLLSEYSRENGEESNTIYWHGLESNDERFAVIRDVFTAELLTSNWCFRQRMDTDETFAVVFPHDLLTQIRADMHDLLCIFDDETDYLFLRQEDGTLVGGVRSTIDDDAFNEIYTIDGSTLALISYTERATTGGKNESQYDLNVFTNIANPISGLFPEILAAFPLTFVHQDGTSATVLAPLDMSILFSDGAEDILMFTDSALENPIAVLNPAEHDVSNGLTLYEGSEE